MRTVKELLSAKGNNVWSIAPDQTVYDAISLMADKNIGALMVVENDRLLGIISERDYTRSVVLLDRASKSTLVRDIMSDQVTSVHPDDTIDACMVLMTEKRFRHLPVLDNSKIVGVLSMPDLVGAVVVEQQRTIAQLESYITQ